MSNKLEGCLGKSFWGGIGAIAAIAALIVAIISIPQLTPIRQAVQAVSGTPAATEPPTAIPSPTPPPKVVTINQTMTCSNCTNFINYSLMVRNATIDQASRQVTMLIGVQNNTTNSAYLYFKSLKLQDMQTGDTYVGMGEGFNGFDITSNQLILVRPTFQNFVPIPGRQYSLSASMAYYDFTPITTKF